MTWAKDQYNKWVPWLEDKFLKMFTKDNKASYATKDHLSKAKVTGNKDVDNIQDNLHDSVAGHIGQGGAAQPVGDIVSKEGINRAERNGRDDKGSYIPNPSSLVGGK